MEANCTLLTLHQVPCSCQDLLQTQLPSSEKALLRTHSVQASEWIYIGEGSEIELEEGGSEKVMLYPVSIVEYKCTHASHRAVALRRDMSCVCVCVCVLGSRV